MICCYLGYIFIVINDNAEKIQTETYNFIEQQSRIADSDTNAFYGLGFR